MSARVVKVKFSDGSEKDYDADAAGNDGTFIVLRKWERVGKRRKLQTVKTLDGASVAWAQVIEHGHVIEVVVGGGKVEPT
jgi:hypothetical protein